MFLFTFTFNLLKIIHNKLCIISSKLFIRLISSIINKSNEMCNNDAKDATDTIDVIDVIDATDAKVFAEKSIRLTEFLWLIDSIKTNNRRKLIQSLKNWHELGINPDTIYYNGWTLLTIAICNANISIIDILIDYGANVSMQISNGLYPIEYATKYDIIKYLVSKGADINSYNKYGLTPLMMATISGNCEQTISLISCGSDIKLQSIFYDRKTSLDFAQDFNNDEILFILKSKSSEVLLEKE